MLLDKALNLEKCRKQFPFILFRQRTCLTLKRLYNRGRNRIVQFFPFIERSCKLPKFRVQVDFFCLEQDWLLLYSFRAPLTSFP